MKRVILSISAIALMMSVSDFAAATASQKKLHETKKHHLKKTKATPISNPLKPYGHFVTVTTTPFMGKETAFTGADLLYNFPAMNEDLTLLQKKQQLEHELDAQGYAINRPLLQISGDLEGQLYSTGGFGTGTSNGVALSNAEIDLNAIASKWATGFMSIAYTSAPVSSGNRLPISTLYLSRGFVTIGNLDVTPFYFSTGLMYLPFGRYASGMLSTPMTKSIGKTRTSTAEFGFGLDNGWNGSVFAYSGSQTSGGKGIFKQGGANIGYRNKFNEEKKGAYSVGAAWISNIADSTGMQNTGLSTANGQFGGFAVAQPATNMSNNNLVHRVGGADVHGKLGYGPVTLIGEYIASMRKFANADMMFNGRGAEPDVMHSEIQYSLPFLPKKYGSSVGVAYDHTWEALALNLPRDSYSTFFSTSLWRNTGESIEYRHDTDYRAADVATGRGATMNINGTGRDRNSVLAELDVYF